MPHAQRPTRGRYGRPWHDGKAPDGFTLNGWRQVRAGGYVRMQGVRRYHAKLAEWVGQWVFAEIQDGWAVNVCVWPNEPWKDPRTALNCTNENEWFADEQRLLTRRRGGQAG